MISHILLKRLEKCCEKVWSILDKGQDNFPVLGDYFVDREESSMLRDGGYLSAKYEVWVNCRFPAYGKLHIITLEAISEISDDDIKYAVGRKCYANKEEEEEGYVEMDYDTALETYKEFLDGVLKSDSKIEEDN